MIVSLILAAAQVASPPAAPARADWCRGVAIETRDGGRANFLGISAEGDGESLRRFRAAADARHFSAAGPSGTGGGGRAAPVIVLPNYGNCPGGLI